MNWPREGMLPGELSLRLQCMARYNGRNTSIILRGMHGSYRCLRVKDTGAWVHGCLGACVEFEILTYKMLVSR